MKPSHPHRCVCGKTWFCANAACRAALFTWCRNQDPASSGQAVPCANNTPEIQKLTRLENLVDFLGNEAQFLVEGDASGIARRGEVLNGLAAGLQREGERRLAIMMLALAKVLRAKPSAEVVLKAREHVIARMNEISDGIRA